VIAQKPTQRHPTESWPFVHRSDPTRASHLTRLPFPPFAYDRARLRGRVLATRNGYELFSVEDFEDDVGRDPGRGAGPAGGTDPKTARTRLSYDPNRL
jgi:hypothetical protein